MSREKKIKIEFDKNEIDDISFVLHACNNELKRRVKGKEKKEFENSLFPNLYQWDLFFGNVKKGFFRA